jgi:zinc protease
LRKLAWAAALVLPTVASAAARAQEPARKPVVRTLANGLTVVAKSAPGSGLVALVCYVDGGNRTEPAELSGLSHYYEHLVFRGGTAKQAELETRKVFTQLGTFYGYTSDDATCFYFIAPLSSLDEALWRHKDAVTKVIVTQEKVAKEREVVLSEYKMSVTDSPQGSLWHDLYRTAFEKHPYGRTTIGLREVIEKCDLERFRSFYQERYVPNHMVISVVGDLPEEKLLEKVQAHWSDLARGRESFELGDTEPPQKQAKLHEESREGIAQSYLALGFHGPGALDPARVVHDVLARALSGGESARLPHELVARRIALGAAAYAPSTKDAGLFAVAIDAEPGKETRALEEAVAVLRGVAQKGVSPDELENAKRRLSTETILGAESVKDEALRFAHWAVMGDPDVGTTYLDKVRAVTAEQVQSAAKSLFRPENATLGVVRPKGGTAVDWLALVAKLSGESPAPAAELVRHASGARIVLEESARAPLVAVEVRVRGGSLAERPGEEGLAALVERCLLRGTKRLDRAAVAREWDRLAVRLGTSSDRESTTLSLRATEETFEPALALLGETIREPAFAPEEVKASREEQLEAIRSVEDDSYSLTNERYALALYGPAHPYGRPLLGTKSTVERFERADLARFHERVYRPENFVVAVVGAISRSRALALLEKHVLSAMRAPGEPASLEAPPLPEPHPGVVVLDRKREQATFDLGLVTVAAADPDSIPLQVAARHLGNELFFRYVYEQGIAYRMWTRLGPGLGARPLTLEMGVTPANFEKARRGLEESVRALVEKPLGDDDVARAKQDLLNRFALARETGADRARSLASWEALGVGFDWEDKLPERLKAITAADVNAALKRRVDPARFTLVIVGDRAALEAAGARFPSEIERPASPEKKREPD